MPHKFSIDFQWIPRDYGNALERATLADLSIAADGCLAMELEDLIAKTISPSSRVSAYSLAFWFASNWWRLRWEPERDSFAWNMSHKVGAVGEGYLWPDVSFSSDGATVLVHAKAAPFRSTGQPIRYLNSFDVFVPVNEFERGIDDFIERVVARLLGVGSENADLIGLWNEVLKERRDPGLARGRKLEAIMGFDPGDAPDHLLLSLGHAADNYGAGAVEEVAAASMASAIADLDELWGAPRAESSKVRLPEIKTLRRLMHDEVRPSLFPWQQATKAAQIARHVWSVGTGPVATKRLSDLLGFSEKLILEPSAAKGPMPAGYRNGASDSFDVFLHNPYSTSRRFALMRLVADHLTAPPDDTLLPATPAKTQRQKFQRAFAQEFLCPYGELATYLNTQEPGDEGIEDAARHFDVSPLLVKTTLVNKGQLERSSLAA